MHNPVLVETLLPAKKAEVGRALARAEERLRSLAGRAGGA